MKTKILALALAASMTAGVAYAQSNVTVPIQTQEGGSEAAAGGTERGTPILPDEQVDNFYTDSTRGTMRTDEEIGTWWKGMTVQDQEAYKQGCTEEFLSTQRDLPESYLNVCKKVQGM